MLIHNGYPLAVMVSQNSLIYSKRGIGHGMPGCLKRLFTVQQFNERLPFLSWRLHRLNSSMSTLAGALFKKGSHYGNWFCLLLIERERERRTKFTDSLSARGCGVYILVFVLVKEVTDHFFSDRRSDPDHLAKMWSPIRSRSRSGAFQNSDQRSDHDHWSLFAYFLLMRI